MRYLITYSTPAAGGMTAGHGRLTITADSPLEAIRRAEAIFRDGVYRRSASYGWSGPGAQMRNTQPTRSKLPKAVREGVVLSEPVPLVEGGAADQRVA